MLSLGLGLQYGKSLSDGTVEFSTKNVSNFFLLLVQLLRELDTDKVSVWTVRKNSRPGEAGTITLKTWTQAVLDSFASCICFFVLIVEIKAANLESFIKFKSIVYMCLSLPWQICKWNELRKMSSFFVTLSVFAHWSGSCLQVTEVKTVTKEIHQSCICTFCMNSDVFSDQTVAKENRSDHCILRCVTNIFLSRWDVLIF